MKFSTAAAATPKILATLLAETIDFGLMVRQVRWSVTDEDTWLVDRLRELERQTDTWADRIATHLKSIGCHPNATTLYVFQWSRLPEYPMHLEDEISPLACLDAALADLHGQSLRTRQLAGVLAQLCDEVAEVRRRLVPKLEPGREYGEKSTRVIPMASRA